MSLSKLYTEWAIKLHAKTAQAAAAAYIGGIVDQGLSRDLQTMLEGGEESIYRSFGALVGSRAGARATSKDIKAVLDALGVAYMTVDSDETHPGVVMYFQRYAAGASRATAAAFSATFANGLVVPRTLEFPHQAAATAGLEVFPYKSGSTGAVVYNEADTIPTAYPELTTSFTKGPLKLNGTEVDGLDRVTIEPGVEVITEGRDSDLEPTFAAVSRIMPVLTANGAHIDITSTLTEDGAYYAASQVVFYARKRSEGGTFVADGTAEHIKFTFGKCRVEVLGVSGNPKSVSLRITPWRTPGVSAVAPLAVNTTSAIT